jgi:PhoPQ-activated pathogenicity-related protein
MLAPPSAPTELDRFLRGAPGPVALRKAGAARIDEAVETRYTFTSQTWRGHPWRHDLTIYQPDSPIARGTAIFVVTGDGPTERDRALIRALLRQARLPVAVLYDVPNQPVFGLREDDLIAHTFERYLETGDPSWPLLFPMTAAALRGIQAVRDATRDDANPITRFVVTGASKRGWTTWLAAAAGLPEVVGIAPLVYDNLDLSAQMAHQLRSWGRFSPMIEPYTARGLQARLDSHEGRRLEAMVDPFAYRARITAPTLVMNGANDPFWTVDALSLVWERLRQPRWSIVVPNAGHDLGDGSWAIAGLAAFARSRAGLGEMPKAAFRVTCGWAAVAAEPGLESLELWIAESDSLDFRAARWRRVGAVASAPGARVLHLSAPPPSPGRRRALLAVAEVTIAGVRARLTSPVHVVR